MIKLWTLLIEILFFYDYNYKGFEKNVNLHIGGKRNGK